MKSYNNLNCYNSSYSFRYHLIHSAPFKLSSAVAPVDLSDALAPAVDCRRIFSNSPPFLFTSRKLVSPSLEMIVSQSYFDNFELKSMVKITLPAIP